MKTFTKAWMAALVLTGLTGSAMATDLYSDDYEVVSIVKKLESGRTVSFNIEGTPIKNDAGEVTSAKVSYDLETAEICAEPAGALAPAVKEHKDWQKDGAYMLMVAMDHGDSLLREANKDKPGCYNLGDLHFTMAGPWTFSFNIQKPNSEGEFENVKFDIKAVKP